MQYIFDPSIYVYISIVCSKRLSKVINQYFIIVKQTLAQWLKRVIIFNCFPLYYFIVPTTIVIRVWSAFLFVNYIGSNFLIFITRIKQCMCSFNTILFQPIVCYCKEIRIQFLSFSLTTMTCQHFRIVIHYSNHYTLLRLSLFHLNVKFISSYMLVVVFSSKI